MVIVNIIKDTYHNIRTQSGIVAKEHITIDRVK